MNKKERIFIGIDVGLKGGIVGVNEDEAVIFREVMPIEEIGKKKTINSKSLSQILLERTDRKIPFVIVEKVHAMPHQGVSSMFKFGYTCGVVDGILSALKIPFQLTTPQTWMASVLKGMPKGNKNSKIFAERNAPEIDWRGTVRSRTIHDGLTDAYCMALYGKRLLLK